MASSDSNRPSIPNLISEYVRSPEGGALTQAALLRLVHSCCPLMSNEDAKDIEARLADNLDLELAVSRRIGLALCSKDGSWFRKLTELDEFESAVAMRGAELALTDYLDRLRELESWLEEARLRVSVAIAGRPDVERVYAAATA